MLEAARLLVGSKGIEAVSLREIATSAEVTPAMVHYYFGNKDGLRRALLESTFEELLEAIRGRLEGDSGDPAVLIELAGQLLAERPWLRGLLLREVLADDASMREMFVERFASHGARMVPRLVERRIAAGAWRVDLDPVLTWVTLVSLVIFPFVARPVLEAALGKPLGDDFANRLAEHSRQLLLEGVVARHEDPL